MRCITELDLMHVYIKIGKYRETMVYLNVKYNVKAVSTENIDNETSANLPLRRILVNERCRELLTEKELFCRIFGGKN